MTRPNQDRNDFDFIRCNGFETSDDARRLPENGAGWLGQVVSNSSDVIGVLEEDGTVRHVSPSVRAVLGYRPEEVVGTNVFDFVHPDDVQRALEALAETLATPGVLPPVEFRARRADGAWRHVEVVRNNRLDDPDVAGVVINLRDVTGRKEGEKELDALRHEYEELVGSVEAIIWKGEAQTLRFTFVSEQAEAILGYPPQRWTEEPSFWSDHIHPEDRDWAVSFCRKAVAEKEDHDFEYRMISADGSVVWLRDIVRVGVEDGVPKQLFGVMVDITGRKKAEEALRESEERYRTVVEQQTELVCRFLPDLTLTFANDAYCRYFGGDPEEFIGKSFIDRVAVEDRAYYGEQLALLDKENPRRTVEHRVLTAEGEDRWQQWTDTAIFDAEGRVVEYQSVGRDVTERRALEERLEHQALHDSLTDLPNRRLFVDRLAQALRRTKRRKGRRVAVLFMDLDGFKVVNDSLGHDTGDGLLVKVAERLGGCLRPEDTLARFGGDEFTVLLEDVRDPDGVVRLAERVVEELREPFPVEGRELYVAASIGVALGCASTKDAEGLLREADTAMYRAKDEGSGCKVFDPFMHGRAVSRLELENDLRRAIEQDEFVVHYQPIVNLQTGAVWGVEALVRWEHPERGLLDPDEFVPVAEESGLVVPMGELVLEKACRQAVEWQREFPSTPPLAMSVNLSGRQLRRPDLHEMIGQALEESGLSASSLGLDITETVYISALDANTAALDRLRALGIRISLDDFGSGYSSLSYLKRLPADILKIDKSFTKGLGVEVEDTAIVQTVVDLAHILGMEAVAEGVEIEEQETLLKEMGCDFAQGFHFARPLPPDEAVAFLSGEPSFFA